MHANNATKSLALPMLLLNINNISMIYRNKTIAAKWNQKIGGRITMLQAYIEVYDILNQVIAMKCQHSKLYIQISMNALDVLPKNFE